MRKPRVLLLFQPTIELVEVVEEHEIEPLVTNLLSEAVGYLNTNRETVLGYGDQRDLLGQIATRSTPGIPIVDDWWDGPALGLHVGPLPLFAWQAYGAAGVDAVIRPDTEMGGVALLDVMHRRRLTKCRCGHTFHHGRVCDWVTKDSDDTGTRCECGTPKPVDIGARSHG